MSRAPEDELTHFISDMYAVEQQALAQLVSAPRSAGHPQLAAAFQEHLGETEDQARRVRECLERRGGSPSAVKDAVMRLGGKGFLLFARIQPETPGKLTAHAYAYEAMEWAGYQMLEHMARRLGDTATATTAAAIARQEHAMMQRLESGFDAAEAASHADDPRTEDPHHLVRHLGEAHALERQLDEMLTRHDDEHDHQPTLATAYRGLQERCHQHTDALENRLAALDASPSTIKDAFLAAFGINWSLFFTTQNDTPAKLAAFVYAFGHLQIAGYELLRRSAERARDPETTELAAEIITHKREANQALAAGFDQAVAATLTVTAS